ncbi:hypothetical protein [Magnetospirillum moscoviense]|uniref:hypothetical protein n=1 Tax=Magnetospirillum moscoviense TaxID=1437059 RepID=UPI0012E71772|nr:hypothetical protein [Magnetospirillum moscoviense]
MFFEKHHPLIIAIMGGAVFWYFGSPLPPKDAFASMMSASAGASAILVGFLSAAKAVLISSSKSPSFEALKDSGYSGELFNFIKSSIEWSIGFAVLCIVLMFINPAERHVIVAASLEINNPFMIVWVCSGIIVIAKFLRVTRIIFSILKQL